MSTGNEGTTGGEDGETTIFNRMLILQGQMSDFMGGGNVEVLVDSGDGIPRHFLGNFGDDFLGPNIDQLAQQVVQDDPNRYGAPPASKLSVDAMPTIEIMPRALGADPAECVICQDEFEVGSKVREMPCKHVYHSDCILPWLAQHNSWPTCRYEMPTDDPDSKPNRVSWTTPLARMANPSPLSSDGGTGALSMLGGSGSRPLEEHGREMAGSIGASAGTTSTAISQSSDASSENNGGIESGVKPRNIVPSYDVVLTGGHF